MQLRAVFLEEMRVCLRRLLRVSSMLSSTQADDRMVCLSKERDTGYSTHAAERGDHNKYIFEAYGLGNEAACDGTHYRSDEWAQ